MILFRFSPICDQLTGNLNYCKKVFASDTLQLWIKKRKFSDGPVMATNIVYVG